MPQASLSEEVQRTIRETLGAFLDRLAGAAFSPRIKVLSIDQVCEVTGLSSSTIYELVKRGDFPRPIKIGGKNGWRESTLIAFLDRKESESTAA
jgi:prophage regulatory protein